jgi:hypothetical protein
MEAFEVVLTFGFQLDRHFPRDPGQGDIGLGAAKFAERGCGDLGQARDAGRGGQHPMPADKIGALAHGLTRKLHRLVVVAADELRVSGDAIVDRQKRIARAQAQGAARRQSCFLPAPAVGESETVVALSKREVRIEAEREFTHLYPFAHAMEQMNLKSSLFLRAERREDGSRTFKLIEGKALETSFGEDLYKKIFGAEAASQESPAKLRAIA